MTLALLCTALLFAPSVSFAPRGLVRPGGRAAASARSRRSMFSGIVEDVGVVSSMRKVDELELWDGSRGEGYELEVTSSEAVKDAYIGCSIAINGVCLTATEIEVDAGRVTFGVAPETLRLTNLRGLDGGDRVNGERALPADARNSGHFVQGHVDGTGVVVKCWREGESLWLKIATPAALMNYIVPKGFIAVDGTSLTVCEVAMPKDAAAQRARGEPEASDGALEADLPEGHGWFTLMLVAHTQTKIVLPAKALTSDSVDAARVNIEVDVLAKYVERGLQGVYARLDDLEAKLQAADRS